MLTQEDQATKWCKPIYSDQPDMTQSHEIAKNVAWVAGRAWAAGRASGL